MQEGPSALLCCDTCSALGERIAFTCGTIVGQTIAFLGYVWSRSIASLCRQNRRIEKRFDGCIESETSNREHNVLHFCFSFLVFFVRKFVGQVSDEAIRVETMFFLGSVLYGHEAKIAEETDFKSEGEGEEVVKVRVFMHGMTALFLERNFRVFHANLGNHDGQ